MSNLYNPADLEPEPELYVQFTEETGYPSNRYPDGYVAPARYVRYGPRHPQAGKIRKSGRYIMVVMWPAAPMHRFDWAQWIHVDQELFLDEVES